MSKKLDTQKLASAYLIHAKDFRETSLLLDFFTEHGFIKAVAKGVRRSNKNNKRGLLQPFVPLLINWYGTNELVTLCTVELDPNFSSATIIDNINTHAFKQGMMPDMNFCIPSDYLAIGFYLNELLYYLLNKYHSVDMHRLFVRYHDLLVFLKSKAPNEKSEQAEPSQPWNKEQHSLILEIKLREFELDLLNYIGYGLQFGGVVAGSNYGYDYEHGFYQVLNDPNATTTKRFLIAGEELLAIKHRDWSNYTTLIIAKKLLRTIIQFHIGNKEFHSRKLYFDA